MVEQILADNLRKTDGGLHLALEPSLQQKLQAGLVRQAEKMMATGRQPMALCAPRVRLAVRALAERAAPSLIALSYSEITPGTPVESVGMLTLDGE
jgi:flagellar biosynthesis protein FlhA